MGWGSTERKLLVILATFLALALIRVAPGVPAEPTGNLPSLVIDPNSAPLEALGALPGLGPALSGRIVEARERTRFESFADLDRRVKGIGPAKAAAIRPFLRFDAGPVPSN